MTQSLKEFKKMILFGDNKSVIIFFNKYKTFEDCLRKGISLKVSFNEYAGNEYMIYYRYVQQVLSEIFENIIPNSIWKITNEYIIDKEYLEMDRD